MQLHVLLQVLLFLFEIKSNRPDYIQQTNFQKLKQIYCFVCYNSLKHYRGMHLHI